MGSPIGLVLASYDKEGAQHMKSVTKVRGFLFAAVLASAGAASAQETTLNAAASPAPADETELLSSEDMGALSGGTGVEVMIDTGQVLTATNSGNSVTGDVVSSGQVNIGSGAFSGYDGIGNFVINTGHNNNLQSSMNVSVVLTPPVPGS
ncbi:MAG: hypothetical protein ABL889_04820 [Terricaulis sp.]